MEALNGRVFISALNLELQNEDIILNKSVGAERTWT